jgi:hypothetical protein
MLPVNAPLVLLVKVDWEQSKKWSAVKRSEVKTKKYCETDCFERAAEETIWAFEMNPNIHSKGLRKNKHLSLKLIYFLHKIHFIPDRKQIAPARQFMLYGQIIGIHC